MFISEREPRYFLTITIHNSYHIESESPKDPPGVLELHPSTRYRFLFDLPIKNILLPFMLSCRVVCPQFAPKQKTLPISIPIQNQQQ